MFSAFKKILSALALLALVIWVFFQYQIIAPQSNEADAKTFIIESGQGVKAIGQNLAGQGFINSPFWFEAYVQLKGLDKNFSAGPHDISAGQNIKEIVSALTKPGASEQNITIIEGWGIKDIAQYLEERNLVTTADFIAEASRAGDSEWDDQYSFLKDKDDSAGLEGYLFPDTYRVFKNADAHDIIKKMLDNFHSKLSWDLREEIKKQKKSIFEIVIMASIIEKEVQQPEDMKKVADIFYKRLKIGQALQSDATINFLTGKGRTRSSAEDLKIDSLYNTYKYPGLPPAPISNPGLNAIMAAIYPEENDFFYFFTTASGEVIYSKNYNEHLLNKNKYLR